MFPAALPATLSLPAAGVNNSLPARGGARREQLGGAEIGERNGGSGGAGGGHALVRREPRERGAGGHGRRFSPWEKIFLLSEGRTTPSRIFSKKTTPNNFTPVAVRRNDCGLILCNTKSVRLSDSSTHSLWNEGNHDEDSRLPRAVPRDSSTVLIIATGYSTRESGVLIMIAVRLSS